MVWLLWWWWKIIKENIETVLLEEGEITSGSSPELLKVTKIRWWCKLYWNRRWRTGHSSGVFVY